jgi:hypothetical protein
VKSPRERRRSQRYPIERELRYRAVSRRKGKEVGKGKTINISSSGVLFTSDEALRPGERMELSISWPVRLDNKYALQLVARGKVVRLEPGRVAIQIQQHEFHTQSSSDSRY